MIKLIVLTGCSGVGKDTMIEAFIASQSSKKCLRLSFSDQLRDLSSTIFPWLPNEHSQEYKNVPYAHPSNDNRFSPREIWIKVAKCVRGIQDNIFADMLAGKVEKLDDGEEKIVFISDLRSWPEDKVIDLLKERFKVVKIRILDNKSTIENCAEIDEPTFAFTVDVEFLNNKDAASKERFCRLVNELMEL